MPVPDMANLAPSPNYVGEGKLTPPYVCRPPGRPRKRRLFSRGEFKVTFYDVTISFKDNKCSD